MSAPQYDPWAVVTLVMKHLAHHGVQHRFTFSNGDPSKAAADLLLTLGVLPVRTDDSETTS